MKIAFIGANSDIATELSLLLESKGHQVVPVVRNALAGAFLRSRGLTTKIADYSKPNPRNKPLTDADVVVLAARAGDDNLRTRATKNRRLVANTVENAPADAAVVFFSSISAFGRDLHGSQMDTIPGIRNYIQEKRQTESVFRTKCDEGGRDGYVLRLGHVFGMNQSRTRQIVKTAAEKDTSLAVSVDPKAPSNVLTTPVLAETVVSCGHRDKPPGRYTTINSPQWSWKRVFQYYCPSGTTIRFFPPDSEEPPGHLRRAIEGIWALLGKIGGDRFYPLRVRLPDRVESYILAKSKREYVAEQIVELNQAREQDIHLSIFEHNPVNPEPIGDLPSAMELTRWERAVGSEIGFQWTLPSLSGE